MLTEDGWISLKKYAKYAGIVLGVLVILAAGNYFLGLDVSSATAAGYQLKDVLFGHVEALTIRSIVGLIISFVVMATLFWKRTQPYYFPNYDEFQRIVARWEDGTITSLDIGMAGAIALFALGRFIVIGLILHALLGV